MINRTWNKFGRLFSTTLLLLSGSGLAHATYVQLTADSQLSTSDAVATYGQADASRLASPFFQSVAGNTLIFATGPNGAFTVEHQGGSFFGDFTLGTPLLYNGGSGPDVISFATPVNEFGLTVESNVIASHLYTMTFFSGATTDLTYTISDDGFHSFFVGAQGTGSSTFNQVRITSDDNDFVVGPASFSASSASAPEPLASLLFLAGFTTLAGLAKLWRGICLIHTGDC